MAALTIDLPLLGDCAHCPDELEHCHGLLVVHADGRQECLDEPHCSIDRAGHRHGVRCVDVLPDCCP